VDIHESLRAYWDEDAPTYDLGHGVSSPAERAAWTRVFRSNLPPPPARVLDVGAGTGFLALALARLGYQVTALDLSPGMLGLLRDSARQEHLVVDVVEGRAESPPAGPFDVVVERLLLWTLPDPVGTLDRWRMVAPDGRLLAFEAVWGAASKAEAWRDRGRERIRRLRGLPPEHHDAYSAEVYRRLPLKATAPAAIVSLVEASGWGPAALERLWDVEWAMALELKPLERPLGVHPQFVVSAGPVAR
jgi:SAM-dependent methyltransferase